MVGSLLGGRGYDRYPGHRIQAIALFLLALTTLLIPVVHSLWILVAIIFLSGILQGTIDVGGNTLLTWTHGEKVGPFMNSLHFFFGVGSFIAPLILARVITASGSILWAFWILSLITLPVSAWLWFLPSPPIRSTETVPSGQQQSLRGQFLLIVLFFVFAIGVELGFGNWISTYSIGLGLADEINAAYLASAFWGSFTISRLIGIWISSRLSHSAILVMDLAGCMVAMFGLILWPSSSVVLWVGTIIAGLSIASIFATGMAYAGQFLNLTGNLVGWILVGAGIGGMTFPWLIGQLFESLGPKVTMPILLGSSMVAFILLLRLIYLAPKKDGRH
jgi:fucose permease